MCNDESISQNEGMYSNEKFGIYFLKEYVYRFNQFQKNIYHFKVIQKLQDTLGDIYSADNVVLSATHTHSGPAGYMQYVLFEVTSLGFVPQTFQALVDGISRVITILIYNSKKLKTNIIFKERFFI